MATIGLWVRTFFVSDDVNIHPSRQSPPRYLDLHVRCDGSFLGLEFKKSTAPMSPNVPGVPGSNSVGLAWTWATLPAAGVGLDLGSWVWWDHYQDQQPGYVTECWRIQIRPWL